VDTLNATVVDVSKVSRSLEDYANRLNNSIQVLQDEFKDLNVKKTKKLAVCGYQYNWDTDDGVITYDSVIAEVNEFDGVALDIESGNFTAPVTGLYEVSAAAQYCRVYGDSAYQYVDLMINNDKEDDFMFQRKLDSGSMWTPCSGFRYVKLDEGDNLYLKYSRDGGTAFIRGLKFCVQLI